MLHNQSWCSISFVPHYSFFLSFPLLVSPLHLASPFPVTNIATFRTIEWVQKDVPTTAASNSLLEQVMIAYLEGWIYHKISADSNWNSTPGGPTASDPEVLSSWSSTLISVSPPDFHDVSPTWYGFEVINVEGNRGSVGIPEAMAILLDAGAESSETTMGTVGVAEDQCEVPWWGTAGSE